MVMGHNAYRRKYLVVVAALSNFGVRRDLLESHEKRERDAEAAHETVKVHNQRVRDVPDNVQSDPQIGSRQTGQNVVGFRPQSRRRADCLERQAAADKVDKHHCDVEGAKDDDWL